MTSMYRDNGFDYKLFTWISVDKLFVTEVSTLFANCGKSIPFFCINGNVAIRVHGRKSTKDFIWSHNVYGRSNELQYAEYTSGDLALRVYND